MARLKKQKLKRKITQTLVLLAGNAYLPGFVEGSIYQGKLKQVCFPGLNCYSCPGAFGACPLGSLQNSIADPYQHISFYVLGFLVLLGGIFGRFICAWLCPFGLIQEWLHKIPSKKIKPEKNKKINDFFKKGPLFFLGAFVVFLPFIGTLQGAYGAPWFCKLVCPSGTLLAGWPLLVLNAGLRNLAGLIFGWKSLLLVVTMVLSVFIMRPFCRYVCPLGAIYGFFNKISLYRVQIEEDKCIQCGKCTRQCPMAVQVPMIANTSDCIRCGECAAVCPTDAIHCGFDKNLVSALVKTREES